MRRKGTHPEHKALRSSEREWTNIIRVSILQEKKDVSSCALRYYLSLLTESLCNLYRGGLMKKKRNKTIFPSSDKQQNRLFRGWILPGSPVPVPTDEHPHRSFTPPPPSLWKRLTAWLRYYYIQTRWDIERRLARKLLRRWGDQF